jgi:hypothetical protein
MGVAGRRFYKVSKMIAAMSPASRRARMLKPNERRAIVGGR